MMDDLEFCESESLVANVTVQQQRPGSVPQTKQQKMNKKKSLEKRGKLLIYSKLDQATQQALDESRKSEWDNYVRFEAISKITRQKALQLLNNGVEALPMQWVEVDKNQGLSTPGKPLPPKYKSRLVARGSSENIFQNGLPNGGQRSRDVTM